MGWAGQNSSFVYGVVLRTLESWTGSFLSAVLSLPDPGLTDIADSTYPLFSLGVGVAASAIAAMILSPLDIVRTRYAPPRVSPSSLGREKPKY